LAGHEETVMRCVQGIVGLSLFACFCGAHALGCVFTLDPDHLDCDLYAHAGCGAGSSASSGGTPPGCVPNENDEPVDDTCGVFVSSSMGDDAGGEGTKEAPYQTLATALSKAGNKPVYACGEPFKEAVTLSTGVALYGALDCMNGWAYDASKKTALTAEPDAIPLTVTSSANGAEAHDFAITAADAMKDGGSSIGMSVDGATAVGLTRCDLVAGNGKAGEKGNTPMDPVGPTDPNNPGIKGNDGQKACTDMVQQFGGAPKENMLCPSASGGPVGGAGGIGFVTSGGDGSSGVPPVAGKGAGGKGETFVGWDCSADGINGGAAVGANGAQGMAGDGIKGDAALGTIDSKGYTGMSGKSGGNGSPGQGGGGGGGAKGKSMCAGASGGGGGAGGCGGHGGLGGSPGGASIGIISLGAMLALDTVSMKVSSGGAGGDGGDGQIGGVGGKGGAGGIGNGTLAACDGGNGGQGGFGGKGGGGRGGHAIGIAYTGMSMPDTKGVTFTKGTPGAGGKGADAMHDGAAGVQADAQAFP
jgi:hypothetical protein